MEASVGDGKEMENLMIGNLTISKLANINGNYQSEVTKMEAEEVGQKTFPEMVVEKIIAILPFPLIFTARGLSKSWLARFSAISSLGSEGEKLLAMSFQKEVAQWSHNWQNVRPVSKTEKDLIGYDHVCRKWRRLTSSLLVPGHSFTAGSHLQIEGTIVYWSSGGCSEVQSVAHLARCTEGIYVANILTRQWKQLPPLPDSCANYVHCLKMVTRSPSEYKLIMVCRTHDYYCFDRSFVHIYDSTSETWSSRISCSSNIFHNINRETSAYLNGVLYMVTVQRMHLFGWEILLAFNIEDATLEEVLLEDASLGESEGRPMSILYVYGNVEDEDLRLVVFSDHLFMIGMDSCSRTVLIWTIDVDSRTFREVGRCAPADFKLNMINTPISESNCIFYQTRRLDGVMLAYNDIEDDWSFYSFPGTPHRWIDISCRPGLNPFMEV